MRFSLLPIIVLFATSILAGCVAEQPDSNNASMNGAKTFESDLEFLRSHGDVRLLVGEDGQRVAVSDQYQGRVMTSTTADGSLSFGWINRPFIQSGATGTAFDNYGGEDRFWLGPEGGQYSLFFPAGAEFVLDDWQVPAGLQEGTWSVVDSSASAVTYRQSMTLTNYSGTEFELEVDRTISLLDEEQIRTALGVDMPESIDWVAFESTNQVVNRSAGPWTEEGGLLSIWILGMYETFDTSWVVVPFDGPSSADVITDAYFGAVPEDRLVVRDGYAVFKADGMYRSKIGVPAAYARPVLGSYSPAVNALTVVHFDLPEQAARYVNSLWELQDAPYDGDVVNSYNDGPPNPGGFYELETSSPALELAPGESHVHRHRTIHFVGDTEALDTLCRSIFGVPLEDIRI